MNGGGGAVRVLYFAWLRERAGTGEETITLPGDETTIAALIALLSAQSPGHAAAFALRTSVRAAVNQVFAGPDTKVRPGDEVAFFPPVTGG
ncbi:MAG: molybdopterin converting factor subunit 1 [Rhodospirillales bacterium]|nr:molybdopterin converting factor subunit 1 [Rhodospirillales bacterium]